MQNAEPTLHDFVLTLLTDASSRAAFDQDPVAALRDAGLNDASPQDVVDAIPLVLDFASASGGDFNLGGEATGSFGDSLFYGGLAGSQDGFVGVGGFESPFGDLGTRAEGGLDGMEGGVGFKSDYGDGHVSLSGSPTEGLSGEFGFDSPHGSGWYKFSAGLDGISGTGGFDLPGLDADSIGRGGDMVTGTVAGYLSNGADVLAEGITDGGATLAGALTDGAGMLAEGIVSGSENTAGLVTDGGAQLSDGVQDPTSIGVPAAVHAGQPELPVDLPAAPAVPGLPGLGDLPINLPVELPELPVDLPALPAVPGLPEVPGLPSVPGVGTVQDVVGGVTGDLPVVSDLTDGLSDGLLGH